MIPHLEIFTENLPASFVEEVKKERLQHNSPNDYIAYTQSMISVITKLHTKKGSTKELLVQMSEAEIDEIIKSTIRSHFFIYNFVNAKEKDLKIFKKILKESTDPVIRSWYAVFFFEEWEIDRRYNYILKQFKEFQVMEEDGVIFDFFDKLDINQFLGYLAFQKYDFSEVKDLLRNIRELYESHEEEDPLSLVYKATFSSILSYHNGLIGDFDDAELLITIAQGIAEELKLPYLSSQVMNNLGSLLLYQGSLREGLAKYREAEDYAETVGNSYGIARIKGNIGCNQLSLGLYDDALKNFLQVRKYAEQISGIAPLNFHITILLNIAETYRLLGKFTKALEYIDMALALEEQNKEITSNLLFIYYHQTKIYLESDDLSNAKHSLKNLNEAMVKLDSEPMKPAYQYLYGLLETKEANFGSAKRAFLETIKLAEGQIVQQLGLIHLKAAFHLANVLLNSYKFRGNPEEFQQALSLIENIVTTAEEKNLKPLLTDALIVRSFMYEILNKQELVESDLITALNIAEEQKLPMHLKRAKERLAQLQERSPRQTKSEKTNVLLEYLGDTLPSIVTSQVTSQPKDIEAVLLGILIMTDSGLPVYSRYFDEDIKKQDMLVSGLITAVSSFIKDVFSSETSGSLKSISHEQVSILIERISQNVSLVFFAEKDCADLQLKLIQMAREIEFQAIEQNFKLTENNASQGESRHNLQQIIEKTIYAYLPDISKKE